MSVVAEESESLTPTLPLEMSDEEGAEKSACSFPEEEEEVEEPASKQRKTTTEELATTKMTRSSAVFSASAEDDRKARALEMLEASGAKWDECADYSGRGMYGRKSVFAAIVPHHPRSELGNNLKTLGMAVDNMAFDWVYYFE